MFIRDEHVYMCLIEYHKISMHARIPGTKEKRFETMNAVTLFSVMIFGSEYFNVLCNAKKTL